MKQLEELSAEIDRMQAEHDAEVQRLRRDVDAGRQALDSECLRHAATQEAKEVSEKAL